MTKTSTTRTKTRTTISTEEHPDARPVTTGPTGNTRSAAVLAIGNELLSGKIRDLNFHYLAGELRQLGTPLVLGMIVPDTVDAIVDAIQHARRRADVVLTTGGVGPTHDDITLEAVGRAFGRDLVPDPGLVEAIHAYYREEVNQDLLTMANVPRGAELIQPAPFFLPVFRVENVYVFPGDPGALKLLFEPWKEGLRQAPFHLVTLELDVDEGAVAPLLRRAEADCPGLSVGSYPRYDEGAPYRVLVTLESKDPEQVRRAADALARALRTTFGDHTLLALGAPAAIPRPVAPAPGERANA